MAETKKTSTAKTSTAKKTGAAKKASTAKKTTTKKTVSKKTTVKKVIDNIEKEVPVVVAEEKKEIKEAIQNIYEGRNDDFNTKPENTRIFIILAVIGLVILLFIGSTIVTNKAADKTVDKVASLKANDIVSVIYLMKSECSYCEINKPNMKELKNTYGVDYYEVDVEKIGSERRNKILEILNIDEDNFGTPTLVLTKSNEVLEVISGVQAFNNLFDKLQKYSVISSKEKLYLNYIDYQGYKQLLTSTTPEVLVLTSTTCHYCIEERPILESIAKDYGVKINWIYLNGAFTSQEEYDEFSSSLSWFANNSDWGTPTTLVIQNGEVVSALSGYREKEDIIKFYKQNGLINE